VPPQRPSRRQMALYNSNILTRQGKGGSRSLGLFLASSACMLLHAREWRPLPCPGGLQHTPRGTWQAQCREPCNHCLLLPAFSTKAQDGRSEQQRAAPSEQSFGHVGACCPIYAPHWPHTVLDSGYTAKRRSFAYI
jgi:hypothetical protein